MFFPEASFWTQENIKYMTYEYERSNVNLDVTANKRTLEKTDHFDISAHLTLDFMSRIIGYSNSYKLI